MPNSNLILLSLKALNAEMNIIDWIYENGDLDFIPKDNIKAYVTNRFNKSLKTLGFKNIPDNFNEGADLLPKTKWFDIEVLGTKKVDFFNKRGIDYSKKTKDFIVTGKQIGRAHV